MERIALEDEGVKAEIAKLQLPPGTTVIGDPWIYGNSLVCICLLDGMFTCYVGSDGIDDERRQFQCFLYARDSTEADSNHYAFPIAISPVVDVQTEKVTRIDILPTGTDAKVRETQPYTVGSANDYIPEAQKLRTDLRTLNVVQPEGASFRVSQGGQVIDWQKWCFRVGFNRREGMVLYDVNSPGR